MRLPGTEEDRYGAAELISLVNMEDISTTEVDGALDEEDVVDTTCELVV